MGYTSLYLFLFFHVALAWESNLENDTTSLRRSYGGMGVQDQSVILPSTPVKRSLQIGNLLRSNGFANNPPMGNYYVPAKEEVMLQSPFAGTLYDSPPMGQVSEYQATPNLYSQAQMPMPSINAPYGSRLVYEPSAVRMINSPPAAVPGQIPPFPGIGQLYDAQWLNPTGPEPMQPLPVATRVIYEPPVISQVLDPPTILTGNKPGSSYGQTLYNYPSSQIANTRTIFETPIVEEQLPLTKNTGKIMMGDTNMDGNANERTSARGKCSLESCSNLVEFLERIKKIADIIHGAFNCQNSPPLPSPRRPERMEYLNRLRGDYRSANEGEEATKEGAADTSRNDTTETS